NVGIDHLMSIRIYVLNSTANTLTLSRVIDERRPLAGRRVVGFLLPKHLQAWRPIPMPAWFAR
ncbi:MAG TPA: hypothetical protein VGK87_14420, partial [Anaerolineae bacterium]